MQQQFTKYVIQRSPGVFVSICGGETSSFHNARMWSDIDRVHDILNVVWKPGQFTFDIPHHMTGMIHMIGPYTDNIVKRWKICKINITAQVDTSDD